MRFPLQRLFAEYQRFLKLDYFNSIGQEPSLKSMDSSDIELMNDAINFLCKAILYT
jgi:hypothetical protein